MENRNKKGELTTTQIVTLVIVIASFAILLFFLTRLDLGKTTESEVCHNSVLARGSSALPKDTIPLNCQRSYICLTADGTCEQMTKPEIIKINSEEDVYSALAENMADCWWMFGEGEINYIGEDWVSKRYCAICSQVAFDDSLYEDEGGIFDSSEMNKEKLYEYISNENVPGKNQTYLDYFLLSKDYLDEVSQQGSFGIINLEKQQYVLTGISSDTNQWTGALGTAAVATIFTASTILSGGTASIIGTLFVAGAGTGGYIFTTPVIQTLTHRPVIPPSIIEVNSNEFEALNCKSIATLS